MSLKKERWMKERSAPKLPVEERAVAAAVAKAKEGFFDGEAQGNLTHFEFVLQQTAYIKKRWWIGQALILVLLWLLLRVTGGERSVERCMGILATLFMILILPELWKNVSSRSMEIEGAALFTLQKVTAARLTAFGLVDLFLITVFVSFGIATTRVTAQDMLVHFLLPMLMTACICLRAFFGRFGKGLLPSAAACMLWLFLWTGIVLREEVYRRISVPVWTALFLLAVVYVCCCVHRILYDKEKLLGGFAL